MLDPRAPADPAGDDMSHTSLTLAHGRVRR